MLSNVVYKLKKDKFLFGIACAALVAITISIFVLGFDVVNILIAKSNSAKLSKMFVGLNIVAIAVDAAVVLSLIVYVVVRIVQRGRNNV